MIFFNTQSKNISANISITNKLFECLNFCITDEKTRYMFSAAYIFKEKRIIFASNGRKAIAISIPKEITIKEGYCYPVKFRDKYFLIPTDLDFKYPDISKVIPNYSKIDPILKNQTYYSKTSRNSKFICNLVRILSIDFNLDYLPVLKYLSPFSVKHGSEKESILFYGNNFKYFFMPIIKKD